MTEFRTIQLLHEQFIDDMGWRNSKSPLESTALICEEIGELTHELRQATIDRVATADEMADIILRVIGLAADLDIDMEQAVLNKVRKNRDNIEAIRAKKRVV